MRSAREIAPGVHQLDVGKGFLRSNVYFVRSGSSWALVDTGSAGQGRSIQEAAGSLFGENSHPAAILLTHDHPDHAGSARELSRAWGCPVCVHPGELPLVLGEVSAFYTYSNPLDRWIVLPWLQIMGSKRTESMLARSSFKDRARLLDPGGPLPGLPDWEVVPTPGHTPGHVAFFRRSDRVLITGDALVTVALNSGWGLLTSRREISGPPWYTTWSWRVAKGSVAVLAELGPQVVAGGHGLPMTGPETPGLVRAFSARFSGSSADHGDRPNAESGRFRPWEA